jgi:hypothetical protein
MPDPIQAAPPLGALVFLACALTSLVLLVAIAVRVLRRRPPGRLPVALAAVVTGWSALVLGVGLAEGGVRFLGAHQEKCFDDWCVSLVEYPPSGGATLRLHNLAHGATMAGSNPRVAFVDTSGALVWSVDSPALRQRLAPGGTALVTVTFAGSDDVTPVGLWVTEGPWVSRLMPGDETSPFHGRWLFRW